MPVDLQCLFKRASARALLVEVPTPDNGGLETLLVAESHWIPFSQILNRSEFASTIVNDSVDTSITVRLTDWIAQQKGIRREAAEENLERFQARHVIAQMGSESFVVEDKIVEGYSEHWCNAPDMRKANMIAAALNLTQGKV